MDAPVYTQWAPGQQTAPSRKAGRRDGCEAGIHSVRTVQSLFQGLVTVMLCDVCACVLSHFSRVQLRVTPQTIAHQAPLSVGLSRQEYCSGWPCPPPGGLPDPGIKPGSLNSSAPGKPQCYAYLAGMCGLYVSSARLWGLREIAQ